MESRSTRPLLLIALAVTFAVSSPARARPARLTVTADSCGSVCEFPLCLIGKGVRRPLVVLCADRSQADVVVRFPPSLTPQGRSLVPKRLTPGLSVLGARVLLFCLAPEDCGQ